MTTYEELLDQAYRDGLIVRLKPLKESCGRIYGNRIALQQGMIEIQKACTLAEELGHWHLTVGNILDQNIEENRKQEHKARRWAFNHLITQKDLVRSARAGCRSSYEIACFLDVTEEFLQEAIADFRTQYGVGVNIGEFFIQYEPYLMVYEIAKL